MAWTANRRGGLAILAKPCRDRGVLLGGMAIFSVEVDQRPPDRGHVQREFAQFGRRDRFAQ